MGNRLETALDHASLVALCKSHLRIILNLEETLFAQIFESEVPLSRELGELFEDAANVFLRMADAISERHPMQRLATHASPSETPSAHLHAD
jgi:hypothetical protein